MQDVANLRRELARFLERDRIRHRGAHPQRAFVQMRHKLPADERDQQTAWQQRSEWPPTWLSWDDRDTSQAQPHIALASNQTACSPSHARLS